MRDAHIITNNWNWLWPPVTHSLSSMHPFVTEKGCQSASYWLSDSLGLSGGRFCPSWQPGAARVHLICSLTAWGCQDAHNGLCDSLGWQGGDFAFSASFLILNEIMRPGRGLLRDCKTLDNLREPSFKALPARYWAITQHRGHGDLLCQAAAHRRGYQVPQEAHALRWRDHQDK